MKVNAASHKQKLMKNIKILLNANNEYLDRAFEKLTCEHDSEKMPLNGTLIMKQRSITMN